LVHSSKTTIPESGLLEFELGKDRSEKSLHNFLGKKGEMILSLWEIESFEKEELILANILWDTDGVSQTEMATKPLMRPCQWKQEKRINSNPNLTQKHKEQ